MAISRKSTGLVIAVVFALWLIPSVHAISSGSLGASETICDSSSQSYGNTLYLYRSWGHLTTVTLPGSACNGIVTAIVSGNMVNFTKLAFGAPSNPFQAFGLGLQGANATVHAPTSTYVEIVALSNSGNPKVYFYYKMPVGSSFVYPPTVVESYLAGTVQIPASQYFTTTGGFAGCNASCVFLNQANATMVLKGPVTSSLTADFYYVPLPSGSGGAAAATTTSSSTTISAASSASPSTVSNKHQPLNPIYAVLAVIAVILIFVAVDRSPKGKRSVERLYANK